MDGRLVVAWRPLAACHGQAAYVGNVGEESRTYVPIFGADLVLKKVWSGGGEPPRLLFTHAGTLEHGYVRSGPLPKVPLLGQSTLVR